MADSGNLIDFDIIEGQKENIQSLPGGRSARTLANLFSPGAGPLQKLATPTPSDTKDLNDAVREEYEVELENISESDDPLDIFDRYVRWTLDAYPSAQATPASQLLPLLERATKTFLNSAQYKNDPRYLKLWISYIRFFSDTPRETFAFLSRHNIGDGLALFYEEFAAWLEGAGRWTQAEEVYKLGIEKEARPAARLLRKFKEFQQRFAARPEDTNEPSSPALPTVRPALGVKVDPFAAAAPRDPQAPQPNNGVGGSGTKKSGRQKLAIFSDADDAPAPAVAGADTSGWDSIGSMADRKKENTMSPRPMAGETLKAGGKKSSTKMAIFKDESVPHYEYSQVTNPAQQQVTVNQKGRTERIAVNLEAMYPTPDILGSELCLEELRAASRGWLGKVWPSEKARKAAKKMMIYDDQNDVMEPIVQKVEKLVIARDPVIVDENGVAQQIPREGKGRRMKIKEVNETQIIRAKLESPSGKKMTKRKASKEQTMTLHTRAATDEIYDLFNQPLPTEEEEEEDEVSDDDDDDDGNTTDGDYTSGAESTRTSQMPTPSEAGDDFDETSDVKSVSEWSEFTERKHVPKMDDDEDENDDTQGSQFSASDDTFDAIEVELPQRNEEEEEEVVTPVSPNMPSNARKMFVPIPPEDYEPARGTYRDPSQISQNRLPFMTPIVEKTESSLGLPTARGPKDYFQTKTPTKERGSGRPPLVELGSSPFREIMNEALPVERIAQPLLGKKVKNDKSTALASKVQPNSAPLAKEIVQKGPIIKDAQCNPVDDYTRNQIFEKLQPPLSTYDGFFEHSDEAGNRSAEIKKFTKAMAKMAKNANDKTSTNIHMPPTLRFPGTSREYTVKRELGAGAFAPVYLLENVASDEEDAEESSAIMGKGAFDAYARKDLEALKMEDPPSAWEFYIMRQAKRRLGVARAAESIINVYEMHLYADECYLIEEFREQGTLLDLINLARAESTASGPGVMDENLVMFFTIELFRTMEALHSKGILHGDLKADNCLVRFDALKDSEVWTSQYRRDGTGGWSKKGIALIDFGRGIDMKAFIPTVQFIADWKTGPQDCAEMRELRPWTYQIDYHGLAGIIHSMLFGKYIDTVVAPDKPSSISSPSASTDSGGFGGFGIATAGNKKIWRVKESFKRYWQTEIWAGVFDLLLNPTMHVEGKEEGSRLPVLRGMKEVREGMEVWLEGNCDKGVGLQSSIRRLEMSIAGRRK